MLDIGGRHSGSIYLLAISLLALSITASAGTVTLTGTCVPQPANSSSLVFNIANSGNDSTAQMVVNPSVIGANVSSQSVNVGALQPDSNATVETNLTDISEPGTHAVYYTVVYQQGTSIFSSVFPCLVPIRGNTTSSLEMAVNSTLSDSGTDIVNVTVYNAGQPVTANVFLALPPLFSYANASQRSYTLQLAQYQSKNLTFRLSFPSSLRVTYDVGAFATYSYTNMSYASLSVFTVSPRQSQVQTSQQPLLLYGILALIAIVVVLLVLSVVRRRRKSGVVK